MDFLHTIGREELASICFMEEIELYCEKDAVGKWNIHLQECKTANLFEFKSKFYVETCDGTGGIELHAFLTTNIRCVWQEKLEFVQTITSSFKKKTNLQLQPDDNYDVSVIIHRDKEEELEIHKCFSSKAMECFISESSGLVLQRLIAYRQSQDIITLRTFGPGLDLCDITYIPHGMKVEKLRNIDFKVYHVHGELRAKNTQIFSWDSYYHKEGWLMFYNQAGSCLYGLIPEPSDKVDSRFYINLQRKHGLRLLYTIDENELKSLVFVEMSDISLGQNLGISYITVDNSSFETTKSFVIHLHTFIRLKDNGFFVSTLVSGVNNHLETSYSFQYDVIQKNGKQEHQRISLIHEKENKIFVETIEANVQIVTHKTSKHKKQQFESFLSKASSFILQRVLASRGLEHELTFTTLDDNDHVSQLILRPLITSTGEKRRFNIECSVVPEIGNISIWNYRYGFDGGLISGHSYDSPVAMTQNNMKIYPKCYPDDFHAILKPITMFGSGKQFLYSVDIEDLAEILFEEKLSVVTGLEQVIGNHRIFVEEHLSDDRHMRVFSNSVFELDGKIFVISIVGTISTSLETLEQIMEENVYENGKQLFHRKAIVKKLPSKYSIFQKVHREEKLCEREFSIDIKEDLPFITESSCILLDRLMTQKKLAHSLRFITLNASLSICYLNYYILPSEWRIVNRKKCKVFCAKREITQHLNKSSLRKSKILQWKLSFSEHGYYIQQEQMHQSLKFVISETSVEDSPSCLPHPVELSHDPPFVTNISTLEVTAINFNDHLSILTDDNEVIGHYSVTVDLIKYRGKDSLLIEVYLFASIEDSVCGTISTAYVDLNLQIHTFRFFEFFKDRKLKIEKSISLTQEAEGYVMQLMKCENSVISHNVKKWCFPRGKMIICEASSILLQRLIAVRKIEDPIEAIAFDAQGNALTMQFSPAIKQHPICGNKIDVVEIRIMALNEKENIRRNWRILLSSSGYCLLREQFGLLGKLVHSSLLSKKKMTMPNEEEVFELPMSSSLSIVCPKLTASILNSFDFCDLTLVLCAEKLDILYSDEEVGVYSIATSNVHYNQHHCLLVQLNLIVDAPNWKLKTSQCDLMLPNLKIIKHNRTHIIEKEKLFLEERISLEMLGSQCTVKQSVRRNKKSNFTTSVVVFNDLDGFVTETSCLLFQKIIVKKNIGGRYQFLSMNEKQNLCRVTVCSLGWKMQMFNSIEVKTFEIEIQITPLKKCTRSWRNFFDQNGVLLMCVPVQIPFILKKSSKYAESPISHLNYSVSLCELQFLDFIESKDLDRVSFLDEGDIIYKGIVKAGKYRALVENVHYEDQHCFSVCLLSNIFLLGRECSTTITAILNEKLQIIQYTLHDFIEPDRDGKTLIRLCDEGFEIEKVCIISKEVFRKSHCIKVREFNILCCEAVSILVVRLMAQKKMENTFELSAVDSNGNMCHTVFKFLGVRNVKLFGKSYCNISKIISETRGEDGHLLIWEYWMSNDGHLLNRQQVGVPLLIVASQEENPF